MIEKISLHNCALLFHKFCLDFLILHYSDHFYRAGNKSNYYDFKLPEYFYDNCFNLIAVYLLFVCFKDMIIWNDKIKSIIKELSGDIFGIFIKKVVLLCMTI